MWKAPSQWCSMVEICGFWRAFPKPPSAYKAIPKGVQNCLWIPRNVSSIHIQRLLWTNVQSVACPIIVEKYGNMKNPANHSEPTYILKDTQGKSRNGSCTLAEFVLGYQPIKSELFLWHSEKGVQINKWGLSSSLLCWDEYLEKSHLEVDSLHWGLSKALEFPMRSGWLPIRQQKPQHVDLCCCSRTIAKIHNQQYNKIDSLSFCSQGHLLLLAWHHCEKTCWQHQLPYLGTYLVNLHLVSPNLKIIPSRLGPKTTCSLSVFYGMVEVA